MPYRTIIALAAFMIYPLAAQTPRACIGQTVPLRPIAMMSCSNAAPVCVTDNSGNYGHWAWMCPGEKEPGLNFLDPALIINNQQSPQLDPVDMMRHIEQLRQLRLQNRQIEEQLNQAPTPPVIAPPTPQANTDVHLTFKMLMSVELFEACGLDKLSPKELAIMDLWLTTYSVGLAKNFSKSER